MDSRGRRLMLRLWLAIIFLILALVVLAISIYPQTRVQQVLPMPPVILPSATPLSLLSVWKGI